MPNIESDQPPQNEVEQIVERYRLVAGGMNDIFTAARLRTEREAWRLPYAEFSGKGSCVYMNKLASERGLEGPARERIIELREERNAATPGESACCPYHREGVGCILGDLKSPFCLRHVDNPEEFRERFDIDTVGMQGHIDYTLQQILTNGEGNATEGDTVSIDTLVDQAVLINMNVIRDIETHPILHPEEIKE